MYNYTQIAKINTAAGCALVYGLTQIWLQQPQAAAAAWTALVVDNVAPHVFWDYDTTAAKVKQFIEWHEAWGASITVEETPTSDSEAPTSDPTTTTSSADFIHDASSESEVAQTTEAGAYQQHTFDDDEELHTPSEYGQTPDPASTSDKTFAHLLHAVSSKVSSAVSSITTTRSSDIASDAYEATVHQAEDDRTFGDDQRFQQSVVLYCSSN